MKHAAPPIVLFFLLLFVYTKLVGPIPFSVTSVTTQKTDVFSVSGEGKTLVRPDIAVVSVGVVTQGPSVGKVKSDLNEKVNTITASLKKLAVGEKDIQTTGYSIHPMYDYRQGTTRISGYSANATLTVKVRNMDNLNALIDAATGSGANTVGSVTFDVSDKEKAENEARQRAVAEAKKKAEQAARVAGFTLGKLVNYAESFGVSPEPIPLSVMTKGGERQESPKQLEPGSTEVIIHVSLSYEIR